MGKRFKEFKKSVKSLDAFKTILFITLIVYVLSIIFVLYFGLVNSLKSEYDFYRKNYFGLPREGALYGWKFSNYIDMFTEFQVMVKPIGERPRPAYFLEMFGNSLLYSVGMSIFTIATQVMVAYACAKYTFKGRNLLYNIAIVVMIIPIIGALASEVQLANTLQLRNSFVGVCIMRCKYPGIYFLVFYATFKSISWTYAEAAQIDGASHLKIFLNIMLPLVSSTLTAVFVLQFIGNFNDYQTPMIFIPDSPTIAYGLFLYKSDTQIAPTKVLAATMFSCVPVVILFIIFRNKIMGNINVGGIKG